MIFIFFLSFKIVPFFCAFVPVHQVESVLPTAVETVLGNADEGEPEDMRLLRQDVIWTEAVGAIQELANKVRQLEGVVDAQSKLIAELSQ